MVAVIKVEGKILKQVGNDIFLKVGKLGYLNTVAHVFITKGNTLEEFEKNITINSKAALRVGPKGSLQLY